MVPILKDSLEGEGISQHYLELTVKTRSWGLCCLSRDHHSLAAGTPWCDTGLQIAL